MNRLRSTPGTRVRHLHTGRVGVIAPEEDQRERVFGNEVRVVWDGHADDWSDGRGFHLLEDLERVASVHLSPATST